jgi:hypothetical protein
MKRTIFYSWQSDLDPALTRNFIEDALKDAVKKIGRDDQISVEPVLDRDTAGLSGSPGIAESIFHKIASCDIFVADVSIINPRRQRFFGPKVRPTSNPNVLIELGFAIMHLGWNRIILIQNTAYGGPEVLPFDLRGRRAIGYKLKSKADRAEQRAAFRDRVEIALRAALSDMSGRFTKDKHSEPRWWGKWQMQYDAPASGGTLFIREVGARGFLFHLLTFSGSHLGEIGGFARFDGPYSAYACIDAFSADKCCELTFRRIPEKPLEIIVDDSTECQHFRGMGAWFAGTYERKSDGLFDLGFLDELDLARLYSITGQYFQPMLDRFQQVGDGERKDTFQARVIAGGVRGMYTFMEGIIMRGGHGQLWAAYIDGDSVRYFTTERDYKQKLPATIEHWRERFKDKTVIFDSPASAIGEEGWGGPAVQA